MSAKTQQQQPQYAPQPDPNAQQYGPMPQPAPNAPQYSPAPQVQQVQYVMMEQSLKGIGGWLIFWMVIFSIGAIGYISIFFASMLVLSDASAIVALIFSPLLAAGYITSVVMMAMQKRLAKLITWITLGVSAVFTTINSIVSYVTGSNTTTSTYSSYSSSDVYLREFEQSIPMLIATIMTSLLVHGLVALYFILSKRVKETLVN